MSNAARSKAESTSAATETLGKELTAKDYRGLDLIDKMTGNSRAIAVAKFRELADALENGTLDGARAQWRRCVGDDAAGFTTLQTVTVQADADFKVGTVQMVTTTITEG